MDVKFKHEGSAAIVLPLSDAMHHYVDLRTNYAGGGLENLQGKMEFVLALLGAIIESLPAERQRRLLPLFGLEEVAP